MYGGTHHAHLNARKQLYIREQYARYAFRDYRSGGGPSHPRWSAPFGAAESEDKDGKEDRGSAYRRVLELRCPSGDEQRPHPVQCLIPEKREPPL